MNPITYKVNNANIVQFTDDLDAGNITPVKALFSEYAESNQNIVIDLTNVHFMDSSGVGAIVFLYKRLITKQLEVIIVGLHGQPEQLFEMLQLNRSLACHSTMNDYLASISSNQVLN